MRALECIYSRVSSGLVYSDLIKALILPSWSLHAQSTTLWSFLFLYFLAPMTLCFVVSGTSSSSTPVLFSQCFLNLFVLAEECFHRIRAYLELQ